MNGQEFYLWFKDALEYVDLAWADKERATVYIQGQKIVLEYDGLKASIDLPENPT
jgi:hypothetical protein